MRNYITLSLETHLFFARIMKEHSLFLTAGFPCKETAWIQRADWFRRQFEALLEEVVAISSGKVGAAILTSQELTTTFTLSAERKTSSLSGIPIDSELTRREQALRPGIPDEELQETFQTVRQINQRSLRLLDGLIEFKESILSAVQSCNLYTANYPLLIEHILREAKLYRASMQEITFRNRPLRQNLRDTEQFWNRIMMEHALFIRGLLDPTEETLIDTADDFAKEFQTLLLAAQAQDNRTFQAQVDTESNSISATRRLRDFKAAGTKGILQCEISSIILPLLADHVLREANHYLRILQV